MVADRPLRPRGGHGQEEPGLVHSGQGVVSRPHQYSLAHWFSVFRIESAPQRLYSLPMDVEKVLARLREELANLEAAILRLKRLPSPAQKKRWAVFRHRKA